MVKLICLTNSNDCLTHNYTFIYKQEGMKRDSRVKSDCLRLYKLGQLDVFWHDAR